MGFEVYLLSSRMETPHRSVKGTKTAPAQADT
jgi:hypothetical protein